MSKGKTRARTRPKQVRPAPARARGVDPASEPAPGRSRMAQLQRAAGNRAMGTVIQVQRLAGHGGSPHSGGPPPGSSVEFDVLDWSAAKLGPPALQNGSDPRHLSIPPSPQIAVSGLVKVDGGPGHSCPQYSIGTTQTAWVAWTVAHYRGQRLVEGSVVVSHRPSMPMRDPAPGGSVWYDAGNVKQPGFCGDAVGVFHRDSPWHDIPKARNNGAVPGNPLNYLRSYSRGLHLVTYLTAQDPAGAFLKQPLRFRYWNSIQEFKFKPNLANPLAMWAYTGQVRVNVGGKGVGEVADAPYYVTAGPTFNANFNATGNWKIDDRP